jgi:hypothetical protein
VALTDDHPDTPRQLASVCHASGIYDELAHIKRSAAAFQTGYEPRTIDGGGGVEPCTGGVALVNRLSFVAGLFRGAVMLATLTTRASSARLIYRGGLRADIFIHRPHPVSVPPLEPWTDHRCSPDRLRDLAR